MEMYLHGGQKIVLCLVIIRKELANISQVSLLLENSFLCPRKIYSYYLSMLSDLAFVLLALDTLFAFFVIGVSVHSNG
jgi:hypothetical protein